MDNKKVNMINALSADPVSVFQTIVKNDETEFHKFLAIDVEVN